MRQISRGVEGYKIILKISLQICDNLKMFLKCSSQMSYFGLKSQIFLNNCEWGIVYLKLKGRKQSLEGRMKPAGRTLAMSDIYSQTCVQRPPLGHKKVAIVQKAVVINRLFL
jgi:hypothetical protein